MSPRGDARGRAGWRISPARGGELRSPSLNADLEFRRRGFALDNGVFTTIDATDPAPRHFDL
jgi:hypothetical protein